jgi:predicted enzyme related to lactoylglutathione lyase
MTNSETYGLTHLAITVSDVNRTKKFYETIFQMQTMYHEKGFLQMTTPGCNDILIFQENKEKPVGYTGGITHFGFRLKDPAFMPGILNKINAAGGIIIGKGEFVPGSPYVFFKDPDGYHVEVWYELLL